MTILMLREFEKLKKGILTLSALAEESLNRSVKAVMERDPASAQYVLRADDEIDGVEMEVEEECLKILALHQPVAHDLRFIVAVLKINNELERVGDLAVNMSENALALMELAPISAPFDISGMAATARRMLVESLDAFVNLDAAAARKVCLTDDEVDAINRDMYVRVKESIVARPRDVDGLIHYLAMSRQLERIADHATNIAQDVIYLVRGEISRHPKREGNKPRPPAGPA
jgi:phosphate transport system protein